MLLDPSYTLLIAYFAALGATALTAVAWRCCATADIKARTAATELTAGARSGGAAKTEMVQLIVNPMGSAPKKRA